MCARHNLTSLFGFILISIASVSQGSPHHHGPQPFRNAAASAASDGEGLVFLPLVASSGYVSRVNVPYFSVADIFPDRYDEMAIFWLGRVTPVENYADVRIAYSDTALELRVAIFDRLLWFDDTPAPADLETWDAVTLFLDVDGNSRNGPDTGAYRLVSQLSWSPQDRDPWQAAYRGDGMGWRSASVPFTTTSGWRGDAPNNDVDDRGWEAGFRIPFSSLGLSGPPAEGTLWRFGVAVHDRDDSAGTPLVDQLWPERLNPLRPASWGQLRFGLPQYSAPPVSSTETTVIRDGLADVQTPDVSVGGTVENLCPGRSSHIWNEWGNRNYGTSRAMNIQNQRDVADWPCFSKYFVAFPLHMIPRGHNIISATLTLDHWGNSGVVEPDQPNTASPSFIHVLTVPADWAETTLTWNNDPQPIENVSQGWVPVVTQCLPAAGPQCMPRNWDVSYAVSKAYATGGPVSFALYSSDSAYHSGKFFTASDTADWAAPARPTLTVVWGSRE